MTHLHPRARALRGRVRSLVAGAVFAALSGCSHNKMETGEDLRPEPIPVHVRNENFLDMNVYVVVSGVARRLGLVTGNSAGGMARYGFVFSDEYFHYDFSGSIRAFSNDIGNFGACFRS